LNDFILEYRFKELDLAYKKSGILKETNEEIIFD
jgi:hypothetical protein